MQRFSVDYGTLPASFCRAATITNPAELLRSPEVYRLLRLCGLPSRECSAESSDYELFRSLCRALPLLTGHPVREDLCALWRELFPNIPLPSPEACDEIWRTASAHLLACGMTADHLLKTASCACLASGSTLDRLPSGVTPMLDGGDLLHTQANTLADWQREIACAVEKTHKRGGDTVRVCLPRHYHFEAPDRYHVEQALQRGRSTSQQKALLLSQLVRELCGICRAASMRLLVEVDCDAREAAALLEYAERTVGLPTLFWGSHPKNADAMLDFQARERASETAWCWRTRELPSRQELLAELDAAAARYPSGRLQIITGTHLLLSPYAQKRALLLLNEYSEKSL